jgi:predicted dienelactone hydrolase
MPITRGTLPILMLVGCWCWLACGQALEPDKAIVAKRPWQVGYSRQNFQVLFDHLPVKRQLDIWYPTSEKEQRYNYHGQIGFVAENASVAAGRHPLIIFSHGFLGASDQSIFLTEACARAGYIVAAMNHADSLGERFRNGGKHEPPKFADISQWNENKYLDRRSDLVALLNQFETWNITPNAAFHQSIDEARLGGLGHSLGG